MIPLPTNKPRFSIVLEPDMSDAVDEYWHQHRYKSKNAAINDLLREALAYVSNESRVNSEYGISSAALLLAKQYDRLDAHGRRIVDLIASEESTRIERPDTTPGEYREKAGDVLKRAFQNQDLPLDKAVKSTTAREIIEAVSAQEAHHPDSAEAK